MKELLCLNCNWKGDETECENMTNEESEILNTILFKGLLYLRQKGYRRRQLLPFEKLSYCPLCESNQIIDLSVFPTSSSGFKVAEIYVESINKVLNKIKLDNND